MLLNTPICDFGWKAPDFKLADPDRIKHDLKTLKGENGTLVIFMCNHCPYVIAIIERLVEDAKILQAEGIGVVSIMSNDYVEYIDDNPHNMKRFAQNYGMTFPYLVDEDQSIARAYDAICTPDFFGFNKDLELQYRGRIDDARMGDPKNRTPELLNAMMMIKETGNGPTEQFASMGCSIKWRD